MAYHLRVRDLLPEQFPQAYPLIQVAGAGLSLEQWLDFAEKRHLWSDRASGILSVQSETRTIYALAAYELRCADKAPCVVYVENFCALGLIDRSAGHILVEALETQGAREGCTEICVCPPSGLSMDVWNGHHIPALFFGALGYAAEDNLMRKRL